MSEKFVFRYFEGREADLFAFYRVPKLLFTDPYFRGLSCEAKVLYGMMLDRMALSLKNNWVDEEGRPYIFFSIEDATELLNCGRNKVIRCMAELDSEHGIGLIERRKQGFGRSNRVYVKCFFRADDADSDDEYVDEETGSAVDEDDYISPEMGPMEKNDAESKNFPVEETSATGFKSKPVEARECTIGFKKGLQRFQNGTSEVPFWDPNKTEYNNNKYNNNKISNLILSDHREQAGLSEKEDQVDPVSSVREKISQQIDYEILLVNNPGSREILKGIAEIILEVELSSSPVMVVARSQYPAELVRERFAQLDSSHIQYVLDCFNENTTQIANVRKYLMAALFNAPVTMKSYYEAAVRHDMPYLVRNKKINIKS